MLEDSESLDKKNESKPEREELKVLKDDDEEDTQLQESTIQQMIRALGCEEVRPALSNEERRQVG